MYAEGGMSSQGQYSHTFFLKDLQAGTSAEKLKRIHFSKTSAEGVYDEHWLQHLIMCQSSVLPFNEIEAAFSNLVPVCVELPVRSKFLDNLFVTPTGDIALIECKLWRNPESRREVVAQIIDYAREMATWNYETLQEAINLTKPLDASTEGKTRRLYDVVSARGETDEASFHDAVSKNLRRGRFLLLIVGDGIREGAESMTEYLQQHAGFHFTLAVVELALFETPAEGYIVQPRLLVRTTNIDRGVVTLADGLEGRVAIRPPSTGVTDVATAGKPRRTTITQEHYFEQLEKYLPGISDKLNGFVDDLSTYNVSPEFGTDCMILRWRPDDMKSWNLGTINHSGDVWMDYLGLQAKNAGLPSLGNDIAPRSQTSFQALMSGKLPKEPRTSTDKTANSLRLMRC